MTKTTKFLNWKPELDCCFMRRLVKKVMECAGKPWFPENDWKNATRRLCGMARNAGSAPWKVPCPGFYLCEAYHGKLIIFEKKYINTIKNQHPETTPTSKREEASPSSSFTSFDSKSPKTPNQFIPVVPSNPHLKNLMVTPTRNQNLPTSSGSEPRLTPATPMEWNNSFETPPVPKTTNALRAKVIFYFF